MNKLKFKMIAILLLISTISTIINPAIAYAFEEIEVNSIEESESNEVEKNNMNVENQDVYESNDVEYLNDIYRGDKIEDSSKPINDKEENLKEVKNNDIEDINKKKNDYLTDETFNSTSGVYSYENIFEKFNIFSFGMVSGSHIVGPVISRDNLSKVTIDYNELTWSELNDGSITISDYHNGVSSYIGGEYKALTSINGGFQWNLKLPTIYFGSSNNFRKNEDQNSPQSLINDKVVLYSHNGYLTDSYINWDLAYDTLVSQSKNLSKEASNNGRSIEVEDIKEGSIFVNSGEIVNISEEAYDKAERITFVADNFYDTYKTIINYNKEGNVHTKDIYISKNDKEIGKPINIENIFIGEYPGQINEGNKHGLVETPSDAKVNLLFNYPYAKHVIEDNNISEGFGHILAPQANIFNKQGTYHGSRIGLNFLSENSEGHMWPMDPSKPVHPILPIEPEEPSKPVHPILPIEPEEPSKPVHPILPIEPEEPSKPVHPILPTEPEEPSKPVHPILPIEPEEPSKPVHPILPIEPEEPSKPVHPILPNTNNSGNNSPSEALVTGAPKTGDSFTILTNIIIISISCSVLYLLNIYIKKQKTTKR